MVYHNLKFKSSKGVFYETFSTPQPGAVEVPTRDNGTRYHVEYFDVQGIVHSARLKEVEFDTGKVEIFELHINQPNGEAAVIQTPIMDARGVSDWAIQIGYFIDQINVGDNISVSLNRKELDKSGKYLKKTMFFRIDDKPLKRTYNKENSPSGVQKAVKDPVTKKESMKWDFTEQHAFYYEVLTKNANRLSSSGQPQYVEEDDGFEELPF